MKKLILILSTTLSLLGFSAFADEDLKCDQTLADKGDLGALIRCSSIQYKSADKKLNDVYKKITQNLSDKKNTADLHSLVKDEKAWIKSKEKECAVYFDRYEYGQEGPIRGFTCYAAKTNERIDALLKKYRAMGL